MSGAWRSLRAGAWVGNAHPGAGRRLGRLVVLAIVGATCSALLGGCFDGTTAAKYADQYWSSYNGNYVSFGPDCTNFVSQAVHAGGASWYGFPSDPSSDLTWFGIRNNDPGAMRWYAIADFVHGGSWASLVGGHDSATWVNVQAFLDNFLFTTNSKGHHRAKVLGWYSYRNGGHLVTYGSTTQVQTNGNVNAPAMPAGMFPGYVYAYNWNGMSLSGASHLAIQDAGVPGQAAPKDRDGFVGDEIAAHTYNRHRMFWSMKDVNPSCGSSTIFFIEINGWD